jgi:hypothetical protein
MPELGTSGSAGGPGWVTARVYPTACGLSMTCIRTMKAPTLAGRDEGLSNVSSQPCVILSGAKDPCPGRRRSKTNGRFPRPGARRLRHGVRIFRCRSR